jgi:hypothetical protein
MATRATRAIRTFWCIFSLARISPPWISLPLRSNSTFHVRRLGVRTRFATPVAGRSGAFRGKVEQSRCP